MSEYFTKIIKSDDSNVDDDLNITMKREGSAEAGVPSTVKLTVLPAVKLTGV